MSLSDFLISFVSLVPLPLVSLKLSVIALKACL
jgi:hypothetical protein